MQDPICNKRPSITKAKVAERIQNNKLENNRSKSTHQDQDQSRRKTD